MNRTVSTLTAIGRRRGTGLGWALMLVLVPMFMAAPSAAEDSLVSPFRQVAEKVVPAVVSIEVTRSVEVSLRDHPFFEQFRFFMPERQVPERQETIPGSGSGFIIDPAGIVVTNHHVVRETESITITLPGERGSYTAELVGADPKTDLAVLRILDTDGRRFPFLERGRSSEARVGDWAIAVGNPLGQLEGSLTVGVISAKGRSDLAIAGGAPAYQDFIQTDAAINFGNSGGPLVDINGRAIGINTAINASGQGIGFAIPMDLANNVIDQLIEHGRVTRAYLGVLPQELDSRTAEALGIDIDRGILVADVVTGTPADQAGLRPGDVITDFDAVPTEDLSHFRFLVAERGVGDRVALRVHRDGKELEKTVELVEYPEDEQEIDTLPHQRDWLGIEVEDLAGSEIAASLSVEADEGVIVTRVRPGSPAERAELRVGDVIQKIKNLRIKNLEDFREAQEKLQDSRKRIGLLVQRQAYSTFLFIDPE
jgi:serine protease Do